jgi:hypothetical protein
MSSTLAILIHCRALLSGCGNSLIATFARFLSTLFYQRTRDPMYKSSGSELPCGPNLVGLLIRLRLVSFVIHLSYLLSGFRHGTPLIYLLVFLRHVRLNRISSIGDARNSDTIDLLLLFHPSDTQTSSRSGKTTGKDCPRSSPPSRLFRDLVENGKSYGGEVGLYKSKGSRVTGDWSSLTKTRLGCGVVVEQVWGLHKMRSC